MEANFYRKTSFFLVETVFLASEKPFFPFIRYSRQRKQFLPREKVFNEFFIPASGSEFSV